MCPQHTVKRVHGWRTFRAWSDDRRDWSAPPRDTAAEAQADCDTLNRRK